MAIDDIGRVTPIWRGFYSAAATYELNDIVIDTAGSVWWHKSPEVTTGVTPAAGPIWAAVIDMSEFSGLIQAAITTAQTALEAAREAVGEVSADTERAETAAENAEASALSASESAAGVGAYAQAAEAAKTAAQTAASQAAASASSAGASASSAGASAQAAEALKTAAQTAASQAAGSAETASGAAAVVEQKKAEALLAIEEKGEEVLESIPADYTELSGDVGELKTQINVDVEELRMVERGTIEIGSVNFYNTLREISGKRIYSDGTLYDNNSATTSDYISIPYFATYLKACCSWNNTPGRYAFSSSRIAFYDGSKTFISPVYDAQTNAVAIPSGAKYVRVSYVSDSGYRKVAFGMDTVLPAYTEYGNAPTNLAIKALENYEPEVSQTNLTFAEATLSKNLLNVDSADDYKQGYWYYSTSVGSTISPQSNQYTALYNALRAKTYGAEKVTIGVDTTKIENQTLYWVGGVDKDMKLLGYTTVNTSTPYTYTLPEGSVYVIASISLSSSSLFDTFKDSVIIASGTALPAYEKYFDPYYLLKNCKAEIANMGTTAELFVPDSYDLVVGDTFQLFYKGILKAVSLDNFMVRAVCNSGTNLTDLYEYTPESAGTKTLTLTLFDANHNKLDQKDVSLVAHAAPSSPASNKNILCVGDSLTSGGEWVRELKRRLTGTGGTPAGDNLSNITFIGLKEKNGANFEGYGGWTFQSFNTANVSANAKVITCTHDKTEADDQHSIYKDANNATWKLETIESGSIKILLMSGSSASFPESGTLTWVSGGTNHNNIVYTDSENAPGNPFWDDSENKVDFSTYAASLGVSTIDFVYVLLGWNSVSVATDTYKTQVQTFIDNVKASFPNAKIVLMGLEIPSRDGLGVNYGAKGNYSDYYALVKYVAKLDDLYAEIAGENTNVYTINISGQFDTEHNMMTQERHWNTRNPGTYQMQSNGVHPANSGYLQIADAAYRHFVGLL